MIRREHFCNKLGELGYHFKRQADRVLLYKKPGNPQFASVPRQDMLDDDYIRAQLRLCGCSVKEIEDFITSYHMN